MKETEKATLRRNREEADGGFAWSEVFKGNGVDVGSGTDPLQVDGCTPFDLPDGGGDRLTDFFPLASQDWIHGSQVLEHAINPVVMLRSWLEVLKPGGYIVCTIPSWELYEGKVWPSRFNGGHRSTWSMEAETSPAPTHCKLPEWLAQFNAEVKLCRLITTNYDFSKVGELFIDQTLDASAGRECFCEFVLRKK